MTRPRSPALATIGGRGHEREHRIVRISDEAAFEVRLTKDSGDGFAVAVDVVAGDLSERDAVLKAIELLVIHLENQSGLRSWEAVLLEGRRRAPRISRFEPASSTSESGGSTAH